MDFENRGLWRVTPPEKVDEPELTADDWKKRALEAEQLLERAANLLEGRKDAISALKRKHELRELGYLEEIKRLEIRVANLHLEMQKTMVQQDLQSESKTSVQKDGGKDWTDEEKEALLVRYEKERMTQQALADFYKVSRQRIGQLLDIARTNRGNGQRAGSFPTSIFNVSSVKRRHSR
jgi:hypothetical protein